MVIKMKKIMSFISIISILLLFTINASAATLYATDGRTIEVDERDVDAWRNVGWYDVPVTVMYSLDGRTAAAAISDVEAWKSVGWYEGPVTVMYAPDGRTAVVANSDIEAWKSVGWYNGSIVTLYAPDGRTKNVGSNEINIWKNSGWYDVPVAIMYAPDGRTNVVPQTSVTDWKNVGWFTTKNQADIEANHIQSAKNAAAPQTRSCPVNGYTQITKIRQSNEAALYICPVHEIHIYMFQFGGFLK